MLSRCAALLALGLLLRGALGCSSPPPAQDLGDGDPISVSVFPSQPSGLSLLLVVDNSPQSAGLQPHFQKSLVGLVRQALTTPCFDDDNVEIVRVTHTEPCPEGTEIWRRNYLWGLNVGIVTTSVGHPDGLLCGQGGPGFHPEQADGGRFLGQVRSGLPGNEYGFLEYRFRDDVDAFLKDVEAQLASVGANGCPFPAPLEAAFRARFEDKPPLSVKWTADGVVRDGIDEALLEAREAFRLYSSHTAIITAQDDCSLAFDPDTPKRVDLALEALKFGSVHQCFLQSDGAPDPRWPSERYMGFLEYVSIHAGVPFLSLLDRDNEPSPVDGRAEAPHFLDWSLLLPRGETPPLNPFMVQSNSPRSGSDPLSGEVLLPPGEPFSIQFEPDEMPPGTLQPACAHFKGDELEWSAIPATRLLQVAEFSWNSVASLCAPGPAEFAFAAFGDRSFGEYAYSDDLFCVPERVQESRGKLDWVIAEMAEGLTCDEPGREPLDPAHEKVLREQICRSEYTEDPTCETDPMCQLTVYRADVSQYLTEENPAGIYYPESSVSCGRGYFSAQHPADPAWPIPLPRAWYAIAHLPDHSKINGSVLPPIPSPAY